MPLSLRLLLLSVLTLSAAQARAEYSRQRLAIELLVAGDELPGHVCIVHKGDSPDSVPFPSSAPGCYSLAKIADDTFHIAQTGECSEPRAEQSAQRSATRSALAVLREQQRADTCSATGCAPVLKLEEQSFADARVMCAASPSGDPERVLVLALQLPGDREGEVHSVSLDGSVVSIDGAWGTVRRPSAAVLGGHYHSAHAASARFDNRMQLRVEARCVRRLLQLPAIIRRGGSWRVAVYPDGSRGEPAEARCQHKLCGVAEAGSCITDSLPVLLAREPTGGRVAAVLSLPASTRDGQGQELALEAHFAADDRSGPLRLRSYDARFDWLVRCEYHGSEVEACPRADLVEAGISCSGRRQAGRCEYSCKAPAGAAAFTLPVTVRFAVGDQEDAWREQLTHIDQTLSGYTPLLERQFSFSSDSASIADRAAGDALDKLTISTPSGLVYEFRPSPKLHEWPTLTVPGGRCGAPLSYRFSGSRAFEPAITKIEAGQITIPSPNDTAVRWSWGGLLAGALAKSLVADLGVRQPPLAPALQVKLATRYHPTTQGAGWSFEAALTALYSQSAFYPLELAAGSSERQRARMLPTWRIGAELALAQLLPPLLALKDGWGPGVLIGAGWRFPAYDGQSEAVGQQAFYLTVGAFVRARLSGPVWLDLTAQYFALEHTQHFTSEDLLGDPSRNRTLTHTLVLSFGPRFWF
jgi:hypothetical protein